MQQQRASIILSIHESVKQIIPSMNPFIVHQPTSQPVNSSHVMSVSRSLDWYCNSKDSKRFLEMKIRQKKDYNGKTKQRAMAIAGADTNMKRLTVDGWRVLRLGKNHRIKKKKSENVENMWKMWKMWNDVMWWTKIQSTRRKRQPTTNS